MPKISLYNYFQPGLDGYHVAYNARSGAVALMTSDNFRIYQRLVENLPHISENVLSTEEKDLLKQLQYGGFVIPDDRDEIQALKFLHQGARYEQSTLGLTIAPTMACNMACQYCFESNKAGRMSSTIVEAIIDFVEKRARYLRSLHISWYGGEPLLAMDIIEDLTTSFLDLIEEYKFDYSSSMISNGYLLSRENVDLMSKLKIRSVQVTLDGPARLHDHKRPLKNGRPSFDTIVNNLIYASTKIGVGVRVNVDKTFNKEVITELLEELTQVGLKDRVGIYFGQLEASTTACGNISESCYDMDDFSRVETEYYRLLLDKGFRIEKLPSPTTTFCMAQNINSFLIDPEGRLYRCFNHAGDTSKSMGTIKYDIDYNHPNFVRLFRFDPFEEEQCRSCHMLPVCMGGCPARRAERDLSKEELCDTWKINLQPMLELIARSRQQLAAASARKEQ